MDLAYITSLGEPPPKWKSCCLPVSHQARGAPIRGISSAYETMKDSSASYDTTCVFPPKRRRIEDASYHRYNQSRGMENPGSGWINLPYQLGLMVGLIIGKGKGEKVEVGIGGRVYKKPVYRTQQGQVRER